MDDASRKRCGLRLASIGATAAIAAVFLHPSTSLAETYTFRIGAGHPVVTPYTIVLKNYFESEVARRISAETGNKVEWIEAYGGSVAKLTEVLGATGSGVLDFGAISVVFEPTKLFLANFPYYVPFTTPDPAKAISIVRKVYDEVPALQQVFEKNGVKFLAVASTGDYNIISTFAWDKIDDLRGHKIGAAGAILNWVKAAGATPVNSNLNDAYIALQTGIVDGYTVFLKSFEAFKLYEPAKNVKIIHFGAMPIDVLTVNLRTWRRLPAPVQKIIQETAREYERRAGELGKKDDDDAVAFMKKAGVKFTTLAPAERGKWVNLLADVPVQAAKDGAARGMPMKEVLQKYLAVLKEAGMETPVAYHLQ